MSTSAGIGRLKQATKDLKAGWDAARAQWHDENARRFEENYILPMLARLRKVELALGHMSSVLQEVRNDCG